MIGSDFFLIGSYHVFGLLIGWFVGLVIAIYLPTEEFGSFCSMDGSACMSTTPRVPKSICCVESSRPIGDIRTFNDEDDVASMPKRRTSPRKRRKRKNNLDENMEDFVLEGKIKKQIRFIGKIVSAVDGANFGGSNAFF